jgi:OmpA-OmpF porin, OOP family
MGSAGQESGAAKKGGKVRFLSNSRYAFFFEIMLVSHPRFTRISGMWYLVACGESFLLTGYPAHPYLFRKNRRIINMRSALKITIVAAAFAPALAFAQAKDGYLTDAAGGVVKSAGANVCVRTSQWTPALAVAECDPDLVKKPAAAAQKAKPAPQKAKAAPAAKPKKPEMLNIEEKIELQNMEFDKADMTADNKTDLDKFMGDLQKPTKARAAVQYGAVIVTGHTDRIGSMKHNMKLSERRAITVKDYIVSKGVDQKLIFWEGKGPKQPIPVTKFCDNKMKRKQLIECLAPNRRVTVEVVGRAQSLAKPKAEAAKPASKPEAKPKP